MCGIDSLKRGIAVHEEQFVVPCEEGDEAQNTECIELTRSVQHPRAECLPVEGNIAAEEEDKDVMHDPIVQPIKEQCTQKRSLGQSVDVEVERRIEA